MVAELHPSGRVNLSRLRFTLPTRIWQRTSGDLMLASLLLGRKNSAINSEVHYDGEHLLHLARLYPGGDRVMIRSALPDFRYPSKPVEEFIPDGFVGARNTPILSELTTAIASIRARALPLFELAPTAWELANPEFVSAFNAVSAWVALRLGYACGIRAVKSPLPWARDIHPVFGIKKWSDKDNRSGYHTRYLWVPADVRIELASYQALLLLICRKLGLGSKWRKEPGFFIDPERQRPELIQPRTLVAHGRDLYAWPCNTHRRVGRQWLRGRVSPSAAYVYMGHWWAEQEPWRICAGRSMRSICSEIEPQIPIFLKELGLEPLPWERLKNGK